MPSLLKSPGMLAAISEKAADPLLVGSLSLEERSFDDLGGVDGAPYDLVFSNLGGLNCTDDIDAVAEGMQRVLKPRGAVVLVLMPPVCPWEVAQVLRGHVRFATRRWSRDPVMANVGGEQQPVWYHTPGRVRRALGPAFEVTALRSFCLLAPPSYFEGFADRHPRLFRSLSRLDNLIGGTWPLNRAGDFYALVARYRG